MLEEGFCMLGPTLPLSTSSKRANHDTNLQVMTLRAFCVLESWGFIEIDG